MVLIYDPLSLSLSLSLSLFIDLPYNSLISCASTSSASLYDALPLVNTLFIDKSCQLYVGIVSNHLRDVREVSIYNIFDVNRRRATIQIDEDYATKSVHFLSRLPQLESVSHRKYQLTHYAYLREKEEERNSIIYK